MIVLSFYPSTKISNHDSCVAISVDGKLVYSYEEQKLSRVNYRESKYLPDRALLSALYTSQIDPKEIDVICLCGPNEVSDPMEIFQRIEKYFGVSYKQVVACPHHVSHTALSVLASGYESCVYWTLDASGEDGICGEFGVFKNDDFTCLETLEGASLATFYHLVTGCCGFADFEEGKVMGLASYGKVDSALYEKIGSLFEFQPSGHVVFTAEQVYEYPKIKWHNFSHDEFRAYKVIQYLHSGLCPKLEEATRPYLPEDIAATAQRLIEDLAIESLTRMLGKHKIEAAKLALGGGFFQNVIVNKSIRETFGCEIYVPPGVSDMGQAAGGALWAHHKFSPQYANANSNAARTGVGGKLSAFQGPGFSDTDIEALLKVFPVEFEYKPGDEVARAAAAEINGGRVVGWFQGKAEFGARALGARSVLADPRDPDSKSRVNQLLKKRDWFMPYAPSILEEHAHKFLKNYCYAPYMTMAFDSQPGVLETIPAAIHVDGTMRPQIVAKEDDPLYYELISEFNRITGVPVVLNTSFNRHGVPIVATPRQALEHLLEGVVDTLCLGSYVAFRKDRPRERSEMLVPESIFHALLGVRKGWDFLVEGNLAAAEEIFGKCSYRVTYARENGSWTIGLNGSTFSMASIDWNEMATKLATQGILPEKLDPAV